MQDIALYIDIEGFGKKFEDGGKKSFIDLTNDLHFLGKNFLKNLSIIQFGGDGFLIHEIIKRQNNIVYFIDLSAALLKLVTLRGGAARAKISQGNMSDISGLYSDEVQNALRFNQPNLLWGTNHNIMIINTVIGSSIINCHNLHGPSGPLLLVDLAFREKLEDQKKSVPYRIEQEVVIVNWIEYNSDLTEKILTRVNLNNTNVKNDIMNYVKNNDLPNDWRENALKMLE